jgi:hypothetical protein
VLKKTVTYKDFNDEEVTEDLYFHFSKAELVELEMREKGGLSNALQRIIDAEDGKSIMAEMKNIIVSAYGKRSGDGRRFIKNDQLREEFLSSEAYSTFFMELLTDATAASAFVNGVIPPDLAADAAKMVLANQERDSANKAKTDESTGQPQLSAVPQPRVVYPDDLTGVSGEDLKKLQEALASGEARLGIPEDSQS